MVFDYMWWNHVHPSFFHWTKLMKYFCWFVKKRLKSSENSVFYKVKDCVNGRCQWLINNLRSTPLFYFSWWSIWLSSSSVSFGLPWCIKTFIFSLICLEVNSWWSGMLLLMRNVNLTLFCTELKASLSSIDDFSCENSDDFAAADSRYEMKQGCTHCWSQ